MTIQIPDPKPHKSVIKEVICRNCGVTLSYVPKDVQTRTTSDYGGGRDTYKYIKCPSCSDNLTVGY